MSVSPQETMMHEVSKFYTEDTTTSEEIRVQHMPSVKETQTRINKAAWQAMFKVRQLHIKEQASSDVKKITLASHVKTSWRNSDKQLEIFYSMRYELTCTVIDAAQQLLKASPNNHFSGFQSVVVGLTVQFVILARKLQNLYKYCTAIQVTG